MCGLAYVFQTAPGLFRPQTFVSGSALNFTRNYPMYVWVNDYIVFVVIGKVWMCYYNSSEDQVVVLCPLCSWERILDLLGLWVGGSRDQTSLSTVFLLFLAAVRRRVRHPDDSSSNPRMTIRTFFTRSCRWSRGILVEKKGLLHGHTSTSTSR